MISSETIFLSSAEDGLVSSDNILCHTFLDLAACGDPWHCCFAVIVGLLYRVRVSLSLAPEQCQHHPMPSKRLPVCRKFLSIAIDVSSRSSVECRNASASGMGMSCGGFVWEGEDGWISDESSWGKAIFPVLLVKISKITGNASSSYGKSNLPFKPISTCTAS